MNKKIFELQINDIVKVGKNDCYFLGKNNNKDSKYLFKTVITGSYFLKEFEPMDTLEIIKNKS